MADDQFLPSDAQMRAKAIAVLWEAIATCDDPETRVDAACALLAHHEDARQLLELEVL